MVHLTQSTYRHVTGEQVELGPLHTYIDPYTHTEYTPRGTRSEDKTWQ